MLGTSNLIGSSGDGGTSTHEAGGAGETEGLVRAPPIMTTGIGVGDDEDKLQSGGGSGGVDLFESDRSTGGNRWPRQETIALLKIRSDMDVVFRDSSLKGPLWEEVSRSVFYFPVIFTLINS